ncbi:hypothetical protein B0H17DRAFT_1226850 [Mycena rosella]|uniref:Uncharacterized protein n=1 Tax=Mycena rosella TaxID=1033263 RepID=A0AAD7D829_MYCRO|nr:hypothetical protein B0H17DRAFT_1226850 [Mycena rosella]
MSYESGTVNRTNKIGKIREDVLLRWTCERNVEGPKGFPLFARAAIYESNSTSVISEQPRSLRVFNRGSWSGLIVSKNVSSMSNRTSNKYAREVIWRISREGGNGFVAIIRLKFSYTPSTMRGFNLGAGRNERKTKAGPTRSEHSRYPSEQMPGNRDSIEILRDVRKRDAGDGDNVGKKPNYLQRLESTCSLETACQGLQATQPRLRGAHKPVQETGPHLRLSFTGVISRLPRGVELGGASTRWLEQGA